MTGRLLVAGLIVVVAWAALALSSEQGPSSWLTLARRYGLLAVVPPAVLVFAAAVVFAPRWAAAAAATAVIVVVSNPRRVRWWWRRAVFRARFVSVARACGLANLNDIRSPSWPASATVDIRSERVEYLPTISWGRSSGPNAVAWRLIPARGSTIEAVADAAPALCAALGVEVIIVDASSPSRGFLEARWAS
ncbi:MAG: hypothetical protein AB7H92_14095 [Microbacteriaceae bacterium]